ncbi:MFS transporter, partial [Campylobacter jejuni]|nr:MFS transporter [Campylobacter jejuni]
APVGIAVVAVTATMFRGRDTPSTRLPVDLLGLILLAVAIGCLQLTLDRGRTLDWFASPFIVTTALLSALGFVFLVIWELGETHPIV